MDDRSGQWRVTQPAGAATERTCSHVDAALVAAAAGAGCGACLASGSTWVHLLACTACGTVGCDDSSPRRHAFEHFTRTGHPIARTLKSGETWAWCYVDDVFLEPVRATPKER
ncbi:UBP-type zinc finger domain-containing protein [Streptacidiphilus jiangxiensis]|uniref:Monovalent cation:H+ antiporter, CPA1 family n=1 Tax=Streptacidiphilus jiangxiensis TaxID=235985 RepID=A0A1H7ZB65_STRJI|nr:UBP-type zinc finger domain-containing protein [Streptacidiphilus jiangxiensis]SEM55566.1 monovalent cation:H+ antiporter, CPA1 family [Streptacidiphilus jiangxiensis]